MAGPTESAASAVNSQILDAVDVTAARVLDQSPALAAGAVYQSLAHATGLLLHNAVAAQQQEAIVAQAALSVGVQQLYRRGDGAVDLAAMLATLRAGTPPATPDAASASQKKGA